MKTLVIILSETRASDLTFNSIKSQLIDRLNADLCVCIGVNKNYDYKDPFYLLAKYRFICEEPEDYGEYFEQEYKELIRDKSLYEILENVDLLSNFNNEDIESVEFLGNYKNNIQDLMDKNIWDEIIHYSENFPDENKKNKIFGVKLGDIKNSVIDRYRGDCKGVTAYKKRLHWREFMKIPWQFFGGIKDKNSQQGSAGILIYFRHFLMKKLIEEDLIKEYDRFIITRSDYMYNSPHPKMETLDKQYIWLPNGENYGGVTDRHTILNRDTIIPYLEIFKNFVEKSNKYFLLLLKSIKDDRMYINLEILIKKHLEYTSLFDKVRFFPYLMYTIRKKDGETRWQKGIYNDKLGYCIKYHLEYASSVKYYAQINELIENFYKTEIEKIN